MQPKGLCIATRCTSIDQFIATFHQLCDETSLFVATRGTRAIGVESPFAILLADNTPALCGWCRVVDAWFDSSSPFGCPGIRISVHRLSSASQEVFTQMQAARIAASPPRRVTQPIASSRTLTPRAAFGGPQRRRPATVTIPPLVIQPRRSGEFPALPRTRTERLGSVPDAAVPRTRTERLGAVPEQTESEETTEPMARSSGAIVQPVRIQTTLRVPTSSPRSKTVPRLRAHSTVPTPSARGSGRFPVSGDRARPDRAWQPSGSPPVVAAEGSQEIRTPGSAVVLPANPLMDLTDETLEGFVECKLYEETNTFFASVEAAQNPEPVSELSAADLEELSLEDVERAVDNLWRPANADLTFEGQTHEYNADSLRNPPAATPPPPPPKAASEPAIEPQPVAASEPAPAEPNLTSLFDDEQPTIASPELYESLANAEPMPPAQVPPPDVELGGTYSLRPRWPLAVAITVSAIVIGFTISYATLRWGSQAQDPNAIVNHAPEGDR